VTGTSTTRNASTAGEPFANDRGTGASSSPFSAAHTATVWLGTVRVTRLLSPSTASRSSTGPWARPRRGTATSGVAANAETVTGPWVSGWLVCTSPTMSSESTCSVTMSGGNYSCIGRQWSSLRRWCHDHDNHGGR